MRFFDRFSWDNGRLQYKSGEGVGKTELQKQLEKDIKKSARTPVYDYSASQGVMGSEKMLPPYAQH